MLPSSDVDSLPQHGRQLEVILQSRPPDFGTQLVSRKRQRSTAATVNDISPPASLACARIQSVHLALKLSSDTSHPTTKDAERQLSTDRPPKYNQEAGFMFSFDTTRWRPPYCIVTERDLEHLSDQFGRALGCLCLNHNSGSKSVNAAQETFFLGSLKSTFPAAFSPEILKGVIERSSLPLPIVRSLRVYKQARQRLDTGNGPRRPSTAATLEDFETLSEDQIWTGMLAALASPVTKLPPLQRHKETIVNVLKSSQSSVEGVCDINPPLAGSGEAFKPCPTRNERDKKCSITSPDLRPFLRAAQSSTLLRPLAHVHRDCGSEEMLEVQDAGTDHWMHDRIVSAVSNQSSTIQSEMSIQSSHEGPATCDALLGDEWESSMSSCQQLSQSSGRSDESELLMLTPNSIYQVEDFCSVDAGYTSQEDLLATEDYLCRPPYDSRVPRDVIDLQPAKISGDETSQPRVRDFPAIGSDCLFRMHESAAGRASTIGLHRTPSMSSSRTEAKVSPPSRSSTSSILTIRHPHRRGSLNSILGRDTTAEFCAPSTVEVDQPCPRSSLEPEVLSRRNSLLQRLRRSPSKPKKEMALRSALDSCNFQGRDVELKRRKTLNDYAAWGEEQEEEDDEAMLFV